MNRLLILASITLSLVAAQQVQAQLNVTVVPSVGPSPASPSISAYQQAELNSLSGGLIGTPGTPGTPTAYSPLGSNFGNNSLVSTASYNSWLGQPGTGSYGGELGNFAYFGLAITGGTVNPSMTSGTGFTLASLAGPNAGAINSNDVGNNLGYTSSVPQAFSNNLVGVEPNGTLTTNDPSANANTVLNALYYTGFGTAFDGDSITNQSQLNNFIAGLNSANGGAVTVSGTYTLSSTVTFSGNGSAAGPGTSGSGAVPEPASMAVLGLGVVSLLGYVYRRQRNLGDAAC